MIETTPWDGTERRSDVSRQDRSHTDYVHARTAYRMHLRDDPDFGRASTIDRQIRAAARSRELREKLGHEA